jgi:hypothetical protein
MPRDPNPTRTPALGATTVLALMILPMLLAPSPAGAGDGRIQINQLRAQAGAINGDIGQDPAGFPVKITSSGSYLLTSNLATAGVSVIAIQISAPDVHIDLNGFEIDGIASCTPSGDSISCTSSGSGDGIRCDAGADRPHFSNGTIRDMSDEGIDCSVATGVRVERLRSIGNAGAGIYLGSRASVSESTLYYNGGGGIIASTGSQFRHNSLYFNGGSAGIDAGNGSNFEGNVFTKTNARHISGGSRTRVIGNVANDSTGVSAFGIEVTTSQVGQGTVMYNVTRNNAERGLYTGSASLVYGNLTRDNTGYGISVENGGSAVANAIISNSLTGIRVSSGVISHGHNALSSNGAPAITAGSVRIGCDVIDAVRSCP